MTKAFPSRNKKSGEEVIAVNDCSFTIPDGKLIGLLGPSGCGKSTTLYMICGLQKPTKGQIFFGEDDVTGLAPEHRGVGLVFQNYNLFPHYTVLKNVMDAPVSVLKRPRAQAEEHARALLAKMGLSGKEDMVPCELSGGQKQRVAIARALAMDPKVMLLDEPTSALDPELVGEVLSVIRDLADGGMTMIMATHQMDFARALATDILFMEQGKIIEQGAPDVLLAPGSGTRTSDFCGKLFDLRGTEKSDGPTVSELLTGDLSHDITDDGSESSMIPDAPKKD